MARKISVEIVGDASNLERTYRRASAQTTSFGRSFGGIKVGALAAVGGLTTVGFAVKGFIDKGTEARTSQRQMQAQLEALGISYDDHAKHIDAVIQKQSMLAGLDDEDLADAFTKIVRVTGDVNKALNLNALAADIARARNMDLGTAAELVGKVFAGKLGVLSRYGIVLDKNATSTEALTELQRRFAGQAEATATSQERLGVAWENIQEKLGQKLLPLLDRFSNWLLENEPKIEAFAASFSDSVGPAISSFGQILESLMPIFKALMPVILAFEKVIMLSMVTPLKIVAAVLKGDWSAAWTAAKAPVIALGDLLSSIGTLVLIPLKAAFQATANFVRDRVSDIAGFFKALPGRIGDTVAGLVKSGLQPFESAFTATSGVVRRVLGWVVDRIDEIKAGAKWIGTEAAGFFGAFKKALGPIVDGLMAILRPLAAIISGIVAGVKWLIENIPNIPSLPSLPDLTPGFNIPGLAAGGIVRRPTFAMIGESGPEAVVPLNQAGALGGGGGAAVNVYVAGSVLSEGRLIDAIHQGLIKRGRTGGELFSRTSGVRV